ncbi:MAG: DUF2029 domain-containing protein [Anaerolineales bacterium]|nr:DUF2029 domain-containing protein [Anaerolineales bacterium]
MNRSRLWIFQFSLIVFILAAVAFFVPNSLPADSDFSALYFTDLALTHNIRIYDIPAMEELAQASSNIPPEYFFMPRFPYPPWYALSTFYLGLLPGEIAKTLWFELNLVMLFLSIWFLTNGWDGRLRLVAYFIGLTFLPVIGTLSVGQYDLPVLLGTAILIYSLRREHIPLTTLGAALLTFKPHIGILILLATLIWLLEKKNDFGRNALKFIILAGVFLFFIGFLADPAWPINYPSMLLNYQGEGNVASCSECANLPVFTSRWFFDGSLIHATQITFLLLVFLVAAFYLQKKTFKKSPELLLTSAVLITLIASPYLYNYDYILLLVPFALLAREGLANKIIVLACHLVPTIALMAYGRAANITLVIVTTLLTILFYLRVRSQVDVKPVTSYNTNVQ